MKLSEIIDLIENIAPPVQASAWDKSGIQVAAFREEVLHLAVMLDPTIKNIRSALDQKADFILSHHPLALQPSFPDKLDNYHAVLSMLFKHDVCLYSAHSSLDVNPNGPAWWLARELDLGDCQVLEATSTQNSPDLNRHVQFGFGFAGNLPSPQSYAAFCKLLATLAGKTDWRSGGPKPELVRKIACCPGSGANMLEAAIKTGAQVYITGDMRYHAALEARIRIIDIGHFQLEEIMMRRVAEQLKTELSGLRVTFIPGLDPLIFEKY